jgi:hypothetical protein
MIESNESYRPHLADILNGVTASHGFAALYAEQHPEHAEAIQEYVAKLSAAKRDLVKALRPEVL